jgi:hypothetical protein
MKGFGCSKVWCVYDKGIKDSGIADRILANIHAAGIETVCYDGVLPDRPTGRGRGRADWGSGKTWTESSESGEAVRLTPPREPRYCWEILRRSTNISAGRGGDEARKTPRSHTHDGRNGQRMHARGRHYGYEE